MLEVYDPSRSPVSYDDMYLPFLGAMFGWDVPFEPARRSRRATVLVMIS